MVDLVLGLELGNLHALIELKVAVLATHATVQKLIEVNVPIIASDAHLEHSFLKLSLSGIIRETNRRWESLKEVM